MRGQPVLAHQQDASLLVDWHDHSRPLMLHDGALNLETVGVDRAVAGHGEDRRSDEYFRRDGFHASGDFCNVDAILAQYRRGSSLLMRHFLHFLLLLSASSVAPAQFYTISTLAGTGRVV